MQQTLRDMEDDGARTIVPPAYTLTMPQSDCSVVFSSPHSGRFYPESFLNSLRVPLMDLRRVEDAYVDELFCDVTEFGAGFIHANYARSYVDLNRCQTELDSRMFLDGPPNLNGERTSRVEAGLGCIPRIAASGEEIYAGKLSRNEAAERLALAYTPYHEALKACLEAVQDKTGQVVLIDCHSMPSVVGGRRVQADIVLGTRHGASCEESLVRDIENELSRLGYRVLRNVPYAGGYLTQTHGRPAEDRHAIQIEINRRLYMSESDVTPNANMKKLRANLMKLTETITDWADKKKPRPRARQES